MAESNYRTGTSTAGSQFHRDFCARIWFYFDSTQRFGGFQTSLPLYRAMPHTELRSCCPVCDFRETFLWLYMDLVLFSTVGTSSAVPFFILLRSLLKLCKTVLENLLFFCPSYYYEIFFFEGFLTDLGFSARLVGCCKRAENSVMLVRTLWYFSRDEGQVYMAGRKKKPRSYT